MSKKANVRSWQLLIVAGLATLSLAVPVLSQHNETDAWKTFARVRREAARFPWSNNYREQRLGRLNTAAPVYAPKVAAPDYFNDVTSEGLYQWPASKMPLKVYVAPGTDVPGYRPQFAAMVPKAFDSWAEASGNRLSWVPSRDRGSADITIDWITRVTERPEGTEAGRTSTLTRLNTETNIGTIYGAKMQLMTRLPDREFADEEVEKTILHETGHALGIQGHSPYREDIMFYAVARTQQPSLTGRDHNTIVRIYDNYPTQNTTALVPKTKMPSAIEP